MERLFGPDGKVSQALGLVKNLMVLGVIALLCCIPVVTVGASLAALNYVALRIARGEEGYIWKDFFHSFCESFRPATVIWLGMLALLALFGLDLYIMKRASYPDFMRGVLLLAMAVILLVMTYVFPMISKFQNTVGGYLKNGILMTVLNLPKAILMLIFYLLPSALGGYFYELLPLSLLFGFSLPAWLSAKLIYGKYFLGMEERACAAQEKECAE